MRVSILVCSHGSDAWRDVAWSRAYPSAVTQDAHEVLVAHEPDATLADVRNRAAATATGDWLCFLDADDELAPGYLDATHEGLARVHAAATSQRSDYGDPFTFVPPVLLAPAVQYLHPTWATAPEIPNAGRWPDVNECVIGTVLPRRLFLDAGGFRELPSLEDYDLWLRCVKTGARIVHVPDAVYVAHVNPDGRNSDQDVYWRLRDEHAEVWA